MNKEVIKKLAAKAQEAVATTRIVSGQREMTWLPEAFEEKFFQLATEWEREACAKVCEDLDAWNLDDPGSTAAAAIREALTSGANEQPAQQPAAFKPFEIETSIEEGGEIHQTVTDLAGNVMLHVLDTQENDVRSALIEMGWTPPQPAQQEPVAWMPIEQMYPQGKAIDILMGDGSILCAVLPQFDGDLWWEGSGTGEKFIDPKYANVTHWRIHDERTSPPIEATPLASQRSVKPWVPLTDEDIDQGLLRSNYAFKTAEAWRAGVVFATTKLKEKNT